MTPFTEEVGVPGTLLLGSLAASCGRYLGCRYASNWGCYFGQLFNIVACWDRCQPLESWLENYWRRWRNAIGVFFGRLLGASA